MRRDRLNKLAYSVGIGKKYVCIWIDDPEFDGNAIGCGHTGERIPASSCPIVNHQECEHNNRFIHLVIEDATPPEETASTTSNEEL
jgi:hypothetical protein